MKLPASYDPKAYHHFLFENSPEGIFVSDAQGHFLDLNPPACAMLGRSQAELLRLSIPDVIAPEGQSQSPLQLDGLRADEELRIERTLTPPGGSPRPLEIRLHRLPDGNLLGIVRDLKLSSQAERETARKDRLIQMTGKLAKVGGWEFDAQTQEGTWTDEVARIHDLDPAQKTNVALGLSFYTGPSRARIEKAVQEAIELGRSYDLELELVSAKGVMKWVRSAGQPVIENGRVVRVEGFFQDITQAKQTENRARYLARLYSTLSQVNQSIVRIHNQPELFAKICEVAVEYGRFHMVWVGLLDPQTGQVSPAAYAGHEAGYLQHIHINIQDGPEQDPIACAILEERVVIVDDIESEPGLKATRLQARQRSYRSLAAVPLRQAGQVIGALKLYATEFDFFSEEERGLLEEIGLDISFALDAIHAESERRQAEEELRESESRYRLLVENNFDGVLLTAPDGRVLAANPAACKIFGRTAEEICQVGRAGLVDFSDPRAQKALDERALTGQFIAEFNCLRGDGTSFPGEVASTLFRDRQGEVRTSMIVRDITERKQAEQEIQRINDQLEQRVRGRTAELEAANQELESFSYSVSHDLRAPLRAINGYTSILMEDFGNVLDSEGQRICGVISSEALRLGQLIDDLLTFSRLGRAELLTTQVDMGEIAETVFQELTSPESRQRIEFQVEKLPSANCDPSLMHQVWANLIANAIKFTSRKQRAAIQVGSRASATETIYFVRDNGSGFDMQYAEKLFGVFQRLHSEREFEGTGVGLAIVQRIIRRHGGRVWGEGEVGQGATFYFALPKSKRIS